MIIEVFSTLNTITFSVFQNRLVLLRNHRVFNRGFTSRVFATRNVRCRATNFVARQRTLTRREDARSKTTIKHDDYGVKRVNFEERKTPSYSVLETPLQPFTLGLGTFSVVLHSVMY